MGALIAPLLRGFHWLIAKKGGWFIATALTWLGITLVSSTFVVQPMLDALMGYATGSGGTGEYWAMGMAWMGVLNFDRALTMYASAILARHGVAAAHIAMVRRVS